FGRASGSEATDDPRLRRRGGSHLRSKLRDVATAGEGRGGGGTGGFTSHLLPGRGCRIGLVSSARRSGRDRGSVDGSRWEASAAAPPRRGPLVPPRGRTAFLRQPGPPRPGRSWFLPREAARDAECRPLLLRGPGRAGDDLDSEGWDLADGERRRWGHRVRECRECRTSQREDCICGSAETCRRRAAPSAEHRLVVYRMTKSLLRVRSFGGRGPTCRTMSRVWVSAARRKARRRCTSTSESP